MLATLRASKKIEQFSVNLAHRATTLKVCFEENGQNNILGYCDVFSTCRLVDAEGPLVRLKKALFDPVLYYSIREWIVEYWYV